MIHKSASLFRQLDRSAGLLDLLESRLRRIGHVKRDLGGQFTITEHAHAILGATNDARFDECSGINRLRCIELLGIDGSLDPTERYFVEVAAEDVDETA